MSEEKYCCGGLKKYVDLGWFFAPEYYDKCWHINTGSGSSYDIPILYCPFCGVKLEEKK